MFEYKNIRYIVLIKLYLKDEVKPQYALLKLHFMRENDFHYDLEIPANVSKLKTEAKTLREFFGIAFSSNLGDILYQFAENLGKHIPTKIPKITTDNEKRAMVYSLSQSDAEDPNKIYCFKVRRNPIKIDGTLGKRSPFNDNKTRLLRKDLYQKLGTDDTLSFCYSSNPLDEKSDEEIILNWTKHHSK